MATKKLTEKQLKSAYAELDAIAGIQPPIVWLSQDQFERELHETVTDLVEPDDKFTDATQSVFDTLAEKFNNEPDVEDEPEEEDYAPVPVDTTDDEEEEVEEELEPEPEPEPVKPKVKAATKKPTAKSPVKKDKTVDDKPKVKAAPKKEKVKQPVSQESDQPESATRADNFATIYLEGVPYTRKEWIKKMQDLYPKKVKNDVGARLHFNVYSKLLITLGKMKVTEDGKYVKA